MLEHPEAQQCQFRTCVRTFEIYSQYALCIYADVGHLIRNTLSPSQILCKTFSPKALKCGVGLHLKTSLCYERVQHPLVHYYVVHGILLAHNENTVHMCTQNTIDSTACFLRDTEHSNVTLIVKAVCS